MNKSASILGCGWLGLPLADHLLQTGYQVKGSTTQTDKLKALEDKGIEAYLIDLSKEGSIAPSFFESDLFVITVPPRSRTQPPGVYLAQMKKLAAFIEHHPQIKQVIYTSSTSVYPDRAGLAKEESVSLLEQSAHKELVEVENTFLALSTIAVTIVRLGGLTGGSRLLVKHFAGKKELPGGHYPVNLLHQQDAVRIVHFAAENKLIGVYNACSPHHPYKKDFYVALAHRFQMALPEFRADQEEGKTIATEKLQKAGYVFSFEDPSAYTYDED
ncbi:MAG: epimerase [Cytophagaceae bacterium]|jgi:nucleoside-diphosphate-sugar epimerase|nr:epimerase [Cytophagaceae bacterium]